VRLGHCQQAAGHVREAILAYLRVEVLFKKEKRWRAEALYQLTELWETDGKPDRSHATATLLKTDYPDSEWAKKLAAAPEK
jgi:TolA-binding protein